MKKYLRLFLVSIQECTAYRGNTFLLILSTFFSLAMFLALWFTVYREGGIGEIEGYTLRETVTYLFGATVIRGILWARAQGEDVNDTIRHGDLAVHLTKPFSMNVYWFFHDLARRLVSGAIGVVLIALLWNLLREWMVSPVSLAALGVSVLFLLCGSLLYFFMFHLLALLSLWMTETIGLRFILAMILEVVAGGMIPLAFFPEPWFSLFSVLPFRFLLSVPLEVYLGHLTIGEAMGDLWGVGAWIIGLMILIHLIWKRGLVRYEAFGQ
jgi:ABC-2 type transport system permease protein